VTTLDETRLVGFMEAVFSLEIDDQQWLSCVLSALGALCGPDHHYRGLIYDASDVNDVKLWNVCAPQTSPELDAAFDQFGACAASAFVTQTLRALPVGSARSTALPHLAPLLSSLEQSGFSDVFFLNGLDASGVGCLLFIGHAGEFAPSPVELGAYRRLAANLATAFRCRRRLGTSTANAATSGTEPSTQEHFEHVVVAAREQLRTVPPSAGTSYLKQREASRNARNFTHPSSGTRLTLVHTFEENGRRYIVARENDAHADGVAALTGREREIVEHATHGYTNKQIAYNLGISDATVRVLMARAANRIGVRTRRELLAHPALRDIRPAPASQRKPPESAQNLI
jgi:DNA-binding NarL/FixJ family response regulator